MSPSNVHLTMDRRWVTDHGYRRAPRDNIHTTTDPLMSLRGTIDLTVGARNLTQPLGEERLVPFLVELLDHLHAIRRQHTLKHIQTFFDEPYELVLLRDGAQLLLTFYHVGLRGDALVHNLPVSLNAFSRACHAAANALHRDLLRVFADDLDASPLFVRLTQRLNDTSSSLTHTSRAHAQPFALVSTTDDALPWRAHGRATAHDVFSFDGTLRFDLHALLCSGTVALEHATQTFVLVDHAPVLAQLLPLLRELERTLERHAAGPRWTTTTSVHPLTVEHLDQERVRISRGADTLILAESQWVMGLCGILDALCTWIVTCHPPQAHNQRVRSIQQRVQALTSWYQDWRSPPTPARAPVTQEVDITHHSGDLTIAPPTDFPFAIAASNLRRLICEPVWSVEHQGLTTQSLPHVDTGRLVIQAPSGWSGHDLSSGEPLWSYPLHSTAGGFSSALIGPHLLLAHANTVELLTTAEGERQWQDKALDPEELHLEPDRVAMVVRQREARLIAAIDDHRLRAWCADTGRVVWEHGLDHGELVALLPTGSRVVCCSDHGWITALDAWHGRALWHRSSKGYPEHGPWQVDGRLVMLSDDPRDDTGVLQAFALSTGESCWTQLLESPPRAAFQISPHQLLCVQSMAEAAEWALYDARTGGPRWVIEAPLVLDETAAQPWYDPTQGRLFVLDSEGQACALQATTGEVIWRTRLPTPSEEGQRPHVFVSSDTLWLFSGGLFLAQPDSGRLMCHLDGLPPHPHTLTPLPSFELLVEDRDPMSQRHRVSLFRMGHFLALVD